MKNPPAEIKMRKSSCKHRKWKQRCRRLTHFLLNVFENSSDPCGIKANIGKINNVLIMPGRLSLHCARLLAGPGWPTSGNMSHVHPPTHGVNSPGERLLKFTLSSPMRCTCTAKAATLKNWDHWPVILLQCHAPSEMCKSLSGTFIFIQSLPAIRCPAWVVQLAAGWIHSGAEDPAALPCIDHNEKATVICALSVSSPILLKSQHAFMGLEIVRCSL